MDYQDLINRAYHAFNARDIDGALNLMHPDVQWPNGWEGGYVHGHEDVRTYWTRQWQEIDPEVTPISMQEKADGQIEVIVHQLIHDRKGHLLTDGVVKHVYTFDGEKIRRMNIQ
ncbi:nuclear transport factor 2 family protein [Spirosoma sp.]|uniref:nuclear transport factor 2 family protein n=1 Tax=Spirosoma sp. TaxID=1899569 RepID=UPI00261A48F2|nr:nuclear transport factor 2 family protein [Spirosoma sp.]MCX6217171.1 nuclear transport factor 2 family protein [Spirosoma sp.]